MPSTPPWTISRTSGAECYSRKKAGQRDEIGNLDCDRGPRGSTDLGRLHDDVCRPEAGSGRKADQTRWSAVRPDEARVHGGCHCRRGDATKPVYTLTVQYVPDATQRFTVALDPALFVNGKLDLDLGSSGNLTGAAATTSTRVIDTFGSLVGLALKAQSTGLLDAGSTLSAYKAAVKSTDDPGCPSVSSSIDEFEQEAGRKSVLR